MFVFVLTCRNLLDVCTCLFDRMLQIRCDLLAARRWRKISERNQSAKSQNRALLRGAAVLSRRCDLRRTSNDELIVRNPSPTAEARLDS